MHPGSTKEANLFAGNHEASHLKDGVMHVPTRDHLLANSEVRLKNHQHQETYWFSSLTSRLTQRWPLVGTCIASSFRSYWERNEKQLETRHYSYLTASGSFRWPADL